MKVLFIPDIHDKWDKAEQIIAFEKPSKTIFLGDYFDSFEGDKYEAIITAEWLNKSTLQTNRIHLIGNHDVHYINDNTANRCSGFSQAKKQAIRHFLTKKTIKSLKWFHVEQNILLSHAGLHPSWLPRHIDKTKNINLQEVTEWLEIESKRATLSLKKFQSFYRQMITFSVI